MNISFFQVKAFPSHTSYYSNLMDASAVLVQVTGTIESVFPCTQDFTHNHVIQQIVLQNVMAVNNTINLPARILLMVRMLNTNDPIPFTVNYPITVKGLFTRRHNDFISYITHCHAPTGFIRYNGKVYK